MRLIGHVILGLVTSALQRRVLRKKLHALGIRWQRRPEKRWVANQLANKQAVQLLLKYLMTTKVGGREGGVEK